jgi:hypothetical protein
MTIPSNIFSDAFRAVSMSQSKLGHEKPARNLAKRVPFGSPHQGDPESTLFDAFREVSMRFDAFYRFFLIFFMSFRRISMDLLSRVEMG